jgi:hypothetical protein
MLAAHSHKPSKSAAPEAVGHANPGRTGSEPASVNPLWRQLATRAPIQAKLAVSQPNDPSEQEADRVADRVMRMATPVLQRTCAACATGGSPCPTCEEKVSGLVQRKAEYSSDASEEAVTHAFGHDLGAGRPLDVPTRTFMESRFDQDFGQVRIHADARAAELAHNFNAHAFTVGQNIFFGAGKFTPSSESGRHLLAHELVHTRQQARGLNGMGGGASSQVQRSSLKGPSTNPKSCGGWTCAPASDCPNPDGKSAPNADASTSWSLTAKLDLDVLKSDDIVTGNDVGHAYVEFNESNGDTYTYGHYPNKTRTPDPAFTPQVPGCTAHPDSTHTRCVDMEIKFALTEAEYKKALGFAQTWCAAGQPYHILTNNCTTFVSNVASQAGKTLPSSRGSVGKGVYQADNPNTLFDAYVSQSDNATWRNRVSGKFTGSYDASGSVVAFKSFELATDEKFAVGGEYSYIGSTGDTVEGKLDGRLIFNVEGASKTVSPIVKFQWSEPSGTGLGTWTVGTAGDLKGTWGRGTADSGAGKWELTKVP